MHTHAPVTEAAIKAQAQLLKSFLQSKNAPLNHMTCLDAVSVQYGYPSWQHARAALTQRPGPAVPPQVSAEAQVKHIADLIVQFGAVHAPVLVSYAKALLKTNLTPVYTGEYERRIYQDGVEHSCRLQAKQPFGAEFAMTVTSELFFDIRFGVNEVYVAPSVMLNVSAASELDWQCCGSDEELGLSLADPDWAKKLQAFVQGVPVQRWVQDELDARGLTLGTASTRFGKILYGR